VPIRLTTWNLHGSARPDIARVAARMRDNDVLTLQEVQRGQARALRRALGWSTAYWSFKHWPLVTRPEGLAVLSRYPLVAARRMTISRGAPPWNHGRRIAQFVELGLGDGATVSLCNTHLGTTGRDDRLAQARRIVGVMPPDALLAGDLNDGSTSPALTCFRSAGLRDAWADAHPGSPDVEAATGWDARAGRPSDRLDYVLVPGNIAVRYATTPLAAGDHEEVLALSDHLSLTVGLDVLANG
jgi:endonuclease/exonuclease/phosphatase family metal-dependent hydrolase